MIMQDINYNLIRKLRSIKRESILAGKFGLELESLRVTQGNVLTQTPHPFPGNKNLTCDFGESQLEIVTPVCDSTQEVFASLDKLKSIAGEVLVKRNPPEYLWSSS